MMHVHLLVNLSTWYLFICHRLLKHHTCTQFRFPHIHTRVWRVRETSWRRSNMEWITFRLHNRCENLGQQQQKGLTVPLHLLLLWLAALKVRKACCTFYHVRVDILVNELGEVAVSQLLDSTPNVAKLEHQQLCTLLQFFIPSSVSRLYRRDKDCEVGGWEIRRKGRKGRRRRRRRRRRSQERRKEMNSCN